VVTSYSRPPGYPSQCSLAHAIPVIRYVPGQDNGQKERDRTFIPSLGLNAVYVTSHVFLTVKGHRSAVGHRKMLY